MQDKNLLEIGQIVRAHGVKGAVKVIKYVDEDFSMFNQIFIGQKLIEAKIIKALPLNKDSVSLQIDVIKSCDMAESYKNQSIYIYRSSYKEFKDKVYLSDLIGVDILDENGCQLGTLLDYEEYGASVILNIKCGAVSYSIPYVDEIIKFDHANRVFVTTRQKFEDLRV